MDDAINLWAVTVLKERTSVSQYLLASKASILRASLRVRIFEMIGRPREKTELS